MINSTHSQKAHHFEWTYSFLGYTWSVDRMFYFYILYMYIAVLQIYSYLCHAFDVLRGFFDFAQLFYGLERHFTHSRFVKFPIYTLVLERRTYLLNSEVDTTYFNTFDILGNILSFLIFLKREDFTTQVMQSFFVIE